MQFLLIHNATFFKTMRANARGGGSYKNMSVQFASKPNFLKTKFDLFHKKVSKSGCAAAHPATTPNSTAPSLRISIDGCKILTDLTPPLWV